jgi:hypothetical protein
LWHLLRAAAHARELHRSPSAPARLKPLISDEAWIGSWEEASGESKPLDVTIDSESNRATLFLAGLDTANKPKRS